MQPQTPDPLADPAVNVFEHTVSWPRLQQLLPGRASRVLDFGCGSGSFTELLASRYPKADVLGVDAAVDLLPAQPQNRCLARYAHWDGSSTLDEQPFDLIIAKLSLHYLHGDQFAEVVRQLGSLLSPRGSFVFSVPFRDRSAAEVEKSGRSPREGTTYVAEVGNSGQRALMTHRAGWTRDLLPYMPKSFVVVIDVPEDDGVAKRLNALLGEPATAKRALKRLSRFDGERPAGTRSKLEFSQMCTDVLRGMTPLA